MNPLPPSERAVREGETPVGKPRLLAVETHADGLHCLCASEEDARSFADLMRSLVPETQQQRVRFSGGTTVILEAAGAALSRREERR